MIRHRSAGWLLALGVAIAIQSSAAAQNAWLSLNLEFNTVGDFDSGGIWTVVAKADSRGLAAALMELDNINFSEPSGYLAPPEFEERQTVLHPGHRQITVGDNPLAPGGPTLDVGVIGGPFPSTYVDHPDLIPFMGNPDLGSFTGGVALATGSFDPGVVPAWFDMGSDDSDANVYLNASFPGGIVQANLHLTVRHVVPEPATYCLVVVGSIAVVLAGRCFRH